MEPRPDKTRKSKEEDRRLMIKKHFVDKQKKRSLSSSKNDKSESSKDVPDSDNKPPINTSDDKSPVLPSDDKSPVLPSDDKSPVLPSDDMSPVNPSDDMSPVNPSDDKSPVNNSEKRPDSPEPNCAICLEPLTNKSFTDSCFHTFCFTCLVEWSKVKPECPLCKQQFKSIVHNVQNDFSYDEYHINSRTSNMMWSFYSGEPRFRYPTTMTPLNILRRNLETYQDTYHSQIESHRMRYAPHAVRMFSNSDLLSREPNQFRNRVYSQDLWVRPGTGNRTRMVSPEFFRRNPACTHRLLPWLNRELVALLQNNETQVTFVLELIMALIARYEITSQEFLIHIEPYLGDRTRHFIHELNNFAISPFDMEAYDRRADYSGPSRSHQLGQDSEVSIVDDLITRHPSIFRSNSLTAATENSSHTMKTLKKIVLKKNADNNWETVTVPGFLNASNPGPSTSSSTNFLDSHTVSTVDEDEECQVLKVLKPRGERTPEIVDLSSDEEVMQTVINVPSDSDNSSSNSPARFEFSPWRMIPRVLPSRKRSPLRCRFTAGISPPSSVSWSTKYPPSPDEYHSPSFMDSDGSSTDIECVYTSELASTSKAKPAVAQNAEKEDNKDSSSNKSPTITTELTISNVQDLNKQEPKKKLSSAIVRPWAMAVQTTSQDSLPKPSKSKRHASSLHLNDDVSSSSDNTTSDNRSPKKLKLRSVVAHFSFDSSEKRHESSHRPSHKKHKDKKKKKKKKHLHKHKHRIYSDSDSS